MRKAFERKQIVRPFTLRSDGLLSEVYPRLQPSGPPVRKSTQKRPPWWQARLRGRLKVERELLRLSGKDGQKWPAIQRSSGKQWRTTRWRPWKIIKDFMEVESGRKPDPSVLTATPMGEGA
jgi:hypothetical protein